MAIELRSVAGSVQGRARHLVLVRVVVLVY